MRDEAAHDDLAAARDDVFRDFYDRHSTRLRWTILSFISGSSVEADDVEQEVWIRAYRGLSRFRGDAQPDTWLTAIARNVSRTALSRNDPCVSLASGQLPASHQPALLDRIVVEKELERLPDGYRSVMSMYVRGYSHEEIGTFLGIATGTSKSQLCKARRRLAKLVA